MTEQRVESQAYIIYNADSEPGSLLGASWMLAYFNPYKYHTGKVLLSPFPNEDTEVQRKPEHRGTGDECQRTWSWGILAVVDCIN